MFGKLKYVIFSAILAVTTPVLAEMAGKAD